MQLAVLAYQQGTRGVCTAQYSYRVTGRGESVKAKRMSRATLPLSWNETSYEYENQNPSGHPRLAMASE